MAPSESEHPDLFFPEESPLSWNNLPTLQISPTVFLFVLKNSPYMIRALAFGRKPEECIGLFAKMLRNDLVTDKHTYPLLLKAFSKSKCGDPSPIHAQTVKLWWNLDSFVQNSLISAYANGRKLDCAYRVFGEILVKDSVAWTAMIDGCVKNAHAKEGLQLFVRMRSLGVDIDGVTIVSVLCAVGMVGDVWFGRWVHGFYVECQRVKWDVYVGTALVDMYGKCGVCDDAQKLFDELPMRNVVTWCALIASYVQCMRSHDAMLVFQKMLLEEVKPNQAVLASVLTACAQMGSLDQGRWIRAYIDKNKMEINSTLGTALIDMYAKCGSINEALVVFQLLPEKDVYPWTAMINGFAMHGHALSSLDLFSHMVRCGVQPNAVTFIGVLCACSHGGLVDQGRVYFESMERCYGVEPNLDHYGCMVDLLARSGHLEEALNLIEGMPMEPDPSLWGALFGACMIHKDFELGERIGEHLIKLQPRRSGRYALLTNMYSLSQKWEKAAYTRKQMKGMVEKTQGCSWIEVNGTTHEFIAFGNHHPQSKDIYMMLERMTSQLKPAG